MSSSALPSPGATTAAATPSTTAAASPTSAPHVTSRRLADLVTSIHPNTKLEPELEALLLELADDFVDNVVVMSSLLARHRRSALLDVKDVQLHLEQHWGMRVAGFFDAEDALPSTIRRPLQDDGKEEQAAAAAGGSLSRGGKDLTAGIPGLQRMRPVRRIPLSEGHRRRLALVHAAQQPGGDEDGRADAEAASASAGDARKRKRSSE